MISPDSWFDLSVRLAQEDGEWRGVGTAANPKQPGLVGDRPNIVLRDGGITLQRSKLSPRPEGPSAFADQFRIFVGPVMEAVLAVGDHVRLRRGGRGERSVIVTRRDSLVFALGAVREDLPQFGIEVTYDPRAGRALPRERPSDLFVTFHVDGRTATIEEGGHGFLEPFHLAVPRIFTIGLPGTATKLAVVPAHPAVTEAMFLESAGRDSGGRPAG